MNNTKIARLRILNEKGLHARAAAKFVELVDKFDVKVVVKKDSLEASGDSIMGELMLGASKGSEIDLVLSGKQSEDTLKALSNLVENLFGEEMWLIESLMMPTNLHSEKSDQNIYTERYDRKRLSYANTFTNPVQKKITLWLNIIC